MPVFASPSTADFAREIGVDIREVARIRAWWADLDRTTVKAHARRAQPRIGRPGRTAIAAPLPDFGKYGPGHA